MMQIFFNVTVNMYLQWGSNLVEWTFWFYKGNRPRKKKAFCNINESPAKFNIDFMPKAKSTYDVDMFDNIPGDRSSIHARDIPKTQK